MVYVHTILRDVAGLFKVGRLVAYYFSTTLRQKWCLDSFAGLFCKKSRFYDQDILLQ